MYQQNGSHFAANITTKAPNKNTTRVCNANICCTFFYMPIKENNNCCWISFHHHFMHSHRPNDPRHTIHHRHTVYVYIADDDDGGDFFLHSLSHSQFFLSFSPFHHFYRQLFWYFCACTSTMAAKDNFRSISPLNVLYWFATNGTSSQEEECIYLTERLSLCQWFVFKYFRLPFFFSSLFPHDCLFLFSKTIIIAIGGKVK